MTPTVCINNAAALIQMPWRSVPPDMVMRTRPVPPIVHDSPAISRSNRRIIFCSFYSVHLVTGERHLRSRGLVPTDPDGQRAAQA